MARGPGARCSRWPLRPSPSRCATAAARSLPVISSRTGSRPTEDELLTSYGFTAEQFRIPVDGWTGGRVDGTLSTDAEPAYIGRRSVRGATPLVVADIHALGSIGAADYLAGNATEVYREACRDPFSFVVRNTFELVLADAFVLVDGQNGPTIHHDTPPNPVTKGSARRSTG